MAAQWSAYEYQPSFVLGFHGCDKKLGQSIVGGCDDGPVMHLNQSEKEYDWLGKGIYFWEGNPARAWQWALQRQQEGKIEVPFVVGAILDLRHCLDLFDHDGLAQVKAAKLELCKALRKAQRPIPKNVGKTPDKAGRKLDCAVMNALQQYREDRREDEYDSVRAPFLEGRKLYGGSGFRGENHIQICVRKTACIKGYFLPITA